MKGIVLAGGNGTRLRPLTTVTSKQLLPVYDKPMILYPINTLIEMGIEDILIICKGDQLANYINLLEDTAPPAINIEFAVQDEPRGLAEAFIIGEDFIGDDCVTLILGDNIIVGDEDSFKCAVDCLTRGHFEAAIFTTKVKEPESYGVIKYDEDGKSHSVVEKPEFFVSNDAVIGIYMFDNKAAEIAKSVVPSKRGELEIVDVINRYMKSPQNENVIVYSLANTTAWFDCGSVPDLLSCANYIQAFESRTGRSIGLNYEQP
tara:strand:+ start:2598 stop:3380 length:783 start_codon:yes stop_codon:yes gene_type:complete